MKRVRLGKTNMYVNTIGLGCMGLSHASGLPTPKEEAVEILRKAHDMGYDFYDTAECYTGVNPDGSTAYNEEVVGEAVKPFRKDIILCTKFGVKHMGDHLEFDSSPETIRKSLEGSLKKLQTDYVDIYYQHRIDPKVEPEVVADVMKELIEEGKIKAWDMAFVIEFSEKLFKEHFYEFVICCIYFVCNCFIYTVLHCISEKTMDLPAFIQHGILCLFRHFESHFYGNHRIQCVCGRHMVDAFF